jgi:hypothetical protein
LAHKENKNTEKGTKIKIQRKEIYGMTQKKMVQPGTGRYQEERKELESNREGTIVGTMKNLSPLPMK